MLVWYTSKLAGRAWKELGMRGRCVTVVRVCGGAHIPALTAYTGPTGGSTLGRVWHCRPGATCRLGRPQHALGAGLGCQATRRVSRQRANPPWGVLTHCTTAQPRFRRLAPCHTHPHTRSILDRPYCLRGSLPPNITLGDVRYVHMHNDKYN